MAVFVSAPILSPRLTTVIGYSSVHYRSSGLIYGQIWIYENSRVITSKYRTNSLLPKIHYTRFPATFL